MRLLLLICLSLLCIASAVIWRRSYITADQFPTVMHGSGVQVYSCQGRLFLKTLFVDLGSQHGAIRLEVDVAGQDSRPVRMGVNIANNRALRALQRDPSSVFITAPRLTLPAARCTNAFGFGYGRAYIGMRPGAWFPPMDYHVVSIPYWAIFTFFTTLAALVAFFYLRQRQRAKLGHCRCGYDLRATPDRCPECGAETRRSIISQRARQTEEQTTR